MEQSWIEFLYQFGVLQTGRFTLKSGRESPYFLNFGRIDSGLSLARMGEHFARAILDWQLEPDLVFGPAYKGLPLALSTVTEFARLTGRDLPYGSFRKEAKQHGDAGTVLGRAPDRGQRIVMIDDVLTTSATKLESIRELERFLGAPPNLVAVVVGVDRLERDAEGRLCSEQFSAETGVPLKAMTTTRRLLDGLHAQGKLDAELHQRCLSAL